MKPFILHPRVLFEEFVGDTAQELQEFNINDSTRELRVGNGVKMRHLGKPKSLDDLLVKESELSLDVDQLYAISDGHIPLGPVSEETKELLQPEVVSHYQLVHFIGIQLRVAELLRVSLFDIREYVVFE